MTMLTAEDIERLEKLLLTVKSLVQREQRLDNILRLNSKLGGTFGEALGLVKLYKIFGESASYEWKGKHQKGYDLLVKRSNSPIKVQIKTSAEEEYVFFVAKITSLDKAVIKPQIELNDFSEIQRRIKASINELDTDVWLLIHAKASAPNFYWIEKQDMAEIVANHYENAVRRRNHKLGRTFNAYIDRNGGYRPHITEKEEWCRELLDRYNKIQELEKP